MVFDISGNFTKELLGFAAGKTNVSGGSYIPLNIRLFKDQILYITPATSQGMGCIYLAEIPAEPLA
jgi:hypothetical protein